MRSLLRSAFVLLMLMNAAGVLAQGVTNVSAEQQGQDLVISYDLEADGPVEVDLFVSTDQGKNWQGPLSSCGGDVGKNVQAGTSKRIRWALLREQELVGDGVRFKVAAKAVNLGTRLNPSLSYGVVKDIDGNSYATIRIGDQEWMAENLRTTRYRDGSSVSNVSDEGQWQSLRTGAWSHYENRAANGSTYGKLYNWFAVADRRNICPKGWHIPTDAEWSTLIHYVGGERTAGGKLKSLILWNAPNTGATNGSGFSAIPSGNRSSNGSSFHLGSSSFFWSSSEAGPLEAWGRRLECNAVVLERRNFNARNGFCVRCVKD